MKFLIVDDDLDIREVLTMFVVSNYDVEISEACDGAEAIELLHTTGPFDMVICDYNMPKKSGAEVFAELRRINETTPFIIFSTDHDKFKKLFPNATGYETLNKPFEEKELTHKIEALFAQKKLPSQKESYLPVSIEQLEKIEAPGVSLFIKLNQTQHIKVLKENCTFDKTEATRFRNKNLTHLYVELLDIKILISNFRKNTFFKIDWDNIDTASAIENLQQDWGLILEASRNFGWSRSITDLAKENIAKTLALVEKTHELKKIFEHMKLSNSKSKHTAHSYSLVFLTSAILKELGWDSPRTIQKMTFACLLHDMDLSDIMFNNKLDLIKYNKLQSELNQQSNYKIFNHPIVAADFVTNWTSCPPDVNTLILQHHEKFDGTGFPHKLNFLNIFPLAGVFIMAEDITYMLLNHPEKNLIEYFTEKESYYSRGDFKKVYAAVLKTLNSNLV